ncbi:MAG TPA: exosortase A [Rhodocyclaceae bacterium]|nr:exosortase A [Rhodocyclaceae bacterium]
MNQHVAGSEAAFSTWAALSPADRKNFWRVVLTLVLGLAWVVGWYRETALEVVDIWWRSDTFAHGLVVFPIFAWLVWRKRDAIAPHAPAPAYLALSGVAAGGALWLLGTLASVAALTHFALFLTLVSTLVALIGWRLARVLMFALLFLFFGVPIGEFLLPVLMKHTADFTVIALRATGIPVYQEGLHFVVPNGRWSVVEACSGLRYLVASLLVGALYAYLNYVSLKRRLIFMLVALAIPIVANWVRAYITVMIGYHFGSEFVEGFIHIVYGWVFFGIVIFLMFMVGARWQEDMPAGVSNPGAGHAIAQTRWAAMLPVAVCVAAFPLLGGVLNKAVEPFSVMLDAPAAQGDWVMVENHAQHDYRPSFKGFRGEMFRTYRRNDGAEVGLYVAYYAEQTPGNELVMYGNSLIGRQESGWVRTQSADVSLPIGEVRRASLRRRNELLDMWSWYWINDRVVTNDYVAKALFALDRMFGRRDDSAVIVITARHDVAGHSGDEIAEDFVTTLWPAIREELDRQQVQR